MTYYKKIINDTDLLLHVTLYIREGYADVSKEFMPLSDRLTGKQIKSFELPSVANRSNEYTGMPFLNGLRIVAEKAKDGKTPEPLALRVQQKSNTLDDILNKHNTLTITLGADGKLQVGGSESLKP